MESIDINSLISDLALILILGAIATVIFKMLKQPLVLGYIVAGFLASPRICRGQISGLWSGQQHLSGRYDLHVVNHHHS